MLLDSIRHDWPEKAGFFISRPVGYPIYTFLHFSSPIQIRIGDVVTNARAGACILYSPGEPQWFRSEADIIHNWMHAGEELSLLLERFPIPQNQIFYPHDTVFISEIFRKIEVEHFSDDPYKEELIDGYITEFFIKLTRALQSDAPSAIVHREIRQKMRAVRRHILSCPEQKWSVAEMARLAALSPSRFHAVYKTLFATSPMQDVIDARINYAQTLLLSDETWTLPMVAEKLGYNDQYHFIRQFKAMTGMTPSAFRKANR
ncbi:MAG: helix-turn-helix transcriptional regulator [Clostridia bacterium]|nr:helix-turn-helix transcriptional regulator [Clostridia bacterium]